MRSMILAAGVSALAASCACAAELTELAVHYAMRTEEAPAIDGRLDEEAWGRAPKFTRYRHSYGDKRQETSIRELWDGKGLYVGIENKESDMDRLRVTARTRDGNQIWADDSAEIYIDPSASGYSMFQFCVNSIGTLGDYWQVDMGFTDWSWSASSAKAACGRTSDAWAIEFFVSWNDLKKTPSVGDVWMFFHQRFSYTDGKGGRSAASTSGGAYHNRRFGYMLFIDKDIPAPGQLVEKLRSLAKPPWVLPLDGGKWIYAGGGPSAAVEDSSAIISGLKGEAESALKSVDKASDGADASKDAVRKLHERFESAGKSDGEFDRMAEYMAVRDAAKLLLDDLELTELIKQ